MTVKDKLQQLFQYMTERDAEALISYYYTLKFKNADLVEPEEWEIQAINEWKNMSDEERMDGAVSHEELIKELGIE